MLFTQLKLGRGNSMGRECSKLGGNDASNTYIAVHHGKSPCLRAVHRCQNNDQTDLKISDSYSWGPPFNIGLDTNYSEVCRGFRQSLQVNIGIICLEVGTASSFQVPSNSSRIGRVSLRCYMVCAIENLVKWTVNVNE